MLVHRSHEHRRTHEVSAGSHPRGAVRAGSVREWGRRTAVALGLAGALLCTSAGGASAAEPGLGGVVDGVVQSSDQAVQGVVTSVADVTNQTAEAVTRTSAPVAEQAQRATQPITRAATPVTEAVGRTAEPVTRTVAKMTDTARRAVEPVTRVVEPRTGSPAPTEPEHALRSVTDAAERAQASVDAGKPTHTRRATPVSVGGILSDPPAATSAGPATAAQPVLQVAPPVAPSTASRRQTAAGAEANRSAEPVRRAGRRADRTTRCSGPPPAPASRRGAKRVIVEPAPRPSPAGATRAKSAPSASAAVGASAGGAAGAAALGLLLVVLVLGAPTLTRPLVDAIALARPWPAPSPLERPG